ncbi:hypothetical protein ACFRAO_43825 [Streptomyces sp. NPDC056656]|uniref:hypothetical protein n=1 Tax=Streptomyces sp. NPDC056656 TaxID=3345895 RepID=UPI0036AF7E0D
MQHEPRAWSLGSQGVALARQVLGEAERGELVPGVKGRGAAGGADDVGAGPAFGAQGRRASSSAAFCSARRGCSAW